MTILRAAGLTDFMIQSGGDLFVAGRRGDRPWRVGIQDPRGAPNTLFAAIELTDAAFSTSGDYERFFIRDGQRYHHILDPDTGEPAQRVAKRDDHGEERDGRLTASRRACSFSAARRGWR